MMRGLMTGMSVSILYLIQVGVMLGVVAWQWLTLLGQPDTWLPERIEITMPIGESIVVGREQLAAPAAEKDHIRLSRDQTGAWWISNISQARAVEIESEGEATLLRTADLAMTPAFSIGAHLFHVDARQPGVLTLVAESGRTLRYDGGLVREPGRIECPDAPFSQVARQGWHSWAPTPLSIHADMELGGWVDCGNRIALAPLPRGAALIEKNREGRFILKPGSLAHAAHAICVRPEAHGGCAPGGTLHEASRPLTGVDRLVVGRTHFDVALEGDRLVLSPRRGVERLFSEQDSPDAGVARQLSTLDIWRWPLSWSPSVWLIGILTMTILGGGIGKLLKPREPLAEIVIGTIGLLLAIVGLGAYAAGVRLGVAWSLLLESLAVAWLLFVGRGSWLSRWTLGLSVLLGLVGLASLQTLGHAGADSDSLRYFQSNAAILSAGWAMLAGYSRRPAPSLSKHSLPRAEFAFLLLTLLALLGLLAQAIHGGEEGVFGFQPVEFAKFALLLLTAHVLALRMDWRDARSRIDGLRLWLRFLFPVLVLLSLVAAALLLVHDFSPLVLMGIWLSAILIAWGTANTRHRAFSPLSLFVALSAGMGYLLQAHDTTWLSQLLPYDDRFGVWAAPELHPHSGEQLARASRLIHLGGETGVATAQGWGVPAIQDDFAPAWFLARFGAVGGALLVLLQTLYLCSLLALGWRFLKTPEGDFRHVWAGRLRYFVLWGGAGLLFGHLLVSWGTNLGWLPVMGQPAPYLSFGGSMLAFLLLPLQWFALEPASPTSRS